MTSESELGLLTSRDAGPVEITNREGSSLFLLLGDHAGNRVPEALASLGLNRGDLDRHIAYDIGVKSLGRELARVLDAPFIAQRYSRLVIDCNRALWHSDSISEASDGTFIPGNSKIAADERLARSYAIYNPYHEAIADLLAKRDGNNLRTIVVSLHSFTPSLAGVSRPWQLGVLYGGGDERFAKAVFSILHGGNLVVGENVPYQFDGTDFTIQTHAIASGRHYAELEVRQDMLFTNNGVAEIVQHLSCALNEAALQIGM